jgi:hypothetical protein
MKSYKDPSFQDRVGRAADAKQKAIDALRARPAADPAALAERAEARERKEAAQAEKREAKKAEAEAAAEAKAAEAAAAAEAVRTAPTDEERKAARDAKYAARKNRK